MDINNYVVPNWASKWRQLGSQLKIQQNLMDIIECNHSQDCETCCSKMFTEWLDTEPAASWGDVITAVDKISSGMY